MRRRGGGGANLVSRAGHVVVAPDKFKGSLTAPQVAAHVAAGLQRFMPTADVRLAPVADGGDGTPRQWRRVAIRSCPSWSAARPDNRSTLLSPGAADMVRRYGKERERKMGLATPTTRCHPAL